MIDELHPYHIVGFAMVLAMIALVGTGTSRRAKETNAETYFLGGRGLGFLQLGASLWVTAFSIMWLMDLSLPMSGLGVWSGVVAAVFVLLLGFVLAPIYLKSKVFTVPQFLTRRFDATTGLVLSGFSILFYVGVKIPLTLMLATWSMERLLGWDILTSARLMVVVMVIGLYTIVGGFASVVRTHFVQAGIAILGTLAMLLFVFLFPPAVASNALSAEVIHSGQSNPWTAMFIGLPIVLTWQWFADQYVIQRILGSRDARSAKKGAMLASVLILTQVVILVALGFLRNGSMGSFQGINGSLFVTGTAGVAFLALIMAALASDFHSAATLFTMDFYRSIYADANDESLVLVGRLSTTMIVILAILAISVVSLVDAQLVSLLQQISVHIAPPIVAVFGLGMFWQRASSKGALWALLCGELFGAVSLVARHFNDAGEWGRMLFINLHTIDLFVFSLISLLLS